MLKGHCLKKGVLIADRKLVDFCLKVECKFLRWKIWRVERNLRRLGRIQDFKENNNEDNGKIRVR